MTFGYFLQHYVYLMDVFWTYLCVCVQGSQRELLNLSQQDYANRIEELNQSLKEAWAADQKVKALKIVIQVTQQLTTLNPTPQK